MANKTHKTVEEDAPVKEIIRSADDFWGLDYDDYYDYEVVDYEGGVNYE